MLICPQEVSVSEIEKKNSLSARNYSKVDIPNSKRKPLVSFLDSENPYVIGEEPGSIAYVPRSTVQFIRNSCIDQQNFSNQTAKEICLNPTYNYESALTSGDVLLCKDANIGDACIFLPAESNKTYVFSSGVVKLNFRTDLERYYCFAFLRDEYFHQQLDSLTPSG